MACKLTIPPITYDAFFPFAVGPIYKKTEMVFETLNQKMRSLLLCIISVQYTPGRIISFILPFVFVSGGVFILLMFGMYAVITELSPWYAESYDNNEPNKSIQPKQLKLTLPLQHFWLIQGQQCVDICLKTIPKSYDTMNNAGN